MASFDATEVSTPPTIHHSQGVQSTKSEISCILRHISDELVEDDIKDMKISLGLLGSEYNKICSVYDLFGFLLERCGHNYKTLIITLYNEMKKLKPGCISEEWEDAVKKYRILFGPDPDSYDIYGRESDLCSLSQLLSPDSEFRVINVCGMAGIGKTYLVKHFLWKVVEECTIYGVDCRGRDVSGVINNLVQQLEPDAFVGEEDPMASLLDSLSTKTKQEQRIVISFDDVSMLSGSEKNEELLRSICRIINTHKQIKCLLTSQEEMETSDENALPSQLALQPILKDHKIRELELEDGLKFLGYDEEMLSENPALKRSLDTCQGHPYCLRLLKILLDDTSEGPSAAMFLQSHLTHARETLMQSLVEHRYNKLQEHQKSLLEMLTLFPDGTLLRHLYKVLYPPASNTGDSLGDFSLIDFCNKTLGDFGRKFWVNITSPDIAAVAERKANYHLTFYHPSMREFVFRKFNQRSYSRQRTATFIRYMLQCIIEMTSDSIVKVRYSSMQISNIRASIIYAIDLLAQQDHWNSSLSILTELGDYELAHLFLFIENYHATFSCSLTKLSETLFRQLEVNFVFRLCCICLTLLRQEQKYEGMDQLVQLANTRADRSPRGPLMNSVFYYCEGILLREYSKYSTDVKQQNKALARFGKARQSMREITVGRNSGDITTYTQSWMVLFYLQSAITHYRKAVLDVPPANSDFKGCLEDIRKAETKNKEMAATTIFTVRLLTQKAVVLATQCDHLADASAAIRKYEDVGKMYSEIFKLLKHWKRELSKDAASTHWGYGIFLYSWALASGRIPFSKPKTSQLLDEAKDQFELGLKLLKELRENSLYCVVKSHIQLADIYCELLKLHYRDAPVKMYNRKVYEHLYEAYNILRQKHNLCNIKKQDCWLKRLKTQLLLYLEKHRYSEEKIRQIRVNLEKIERVADQTDIDNCSLSGSELSFYSSLSSDDGEDKRLLTQKAVVLGTQGDRLADLSAAMRKYEDAGNIYSELLKLLKHWRREFSNDAASTHWGCGICHYSWALVSGRMPLSKPKTSQLLDEAKGQFEHGLKLFKELGENSLYFVVKSHIRIADVYIELLKLRYRDAPVRTYNRKVYEHLYEAYNILRQKHHLCNIKKHDYWLKHLKTQLLVYLESQKHRYSEERIRQIKVNLERIERIADQTDIDNCSLSGSELSLYSSLSSDDGEDECSVNSVSHQFGLSTVSGAIEDLFQQPPLKRKHH